MKEIKVMLDDGAYMPTRAHAEDAGIDLRAREACTIPPRGNAVFETGVHIEIPVGYAGFLKSKSGLNVKYNVTSDGTIDAGYGGSITVKLYNNGDLPVNIEAGQKISQLVIQPVALPVPVLVEKIGQGERGENGFGSTGKY